MSKINDLEVRARLRRISEGYRDRLPPGLRYDLVRSGVVASRSGRSSWAAGYRVSRLVAAAALLAILLLPGLMVESPEKTPPDVRGLTAQQLGGQVVLTWQNGGTPHRIVRATSLEMLQQASSLPGEVVRGERWVDTKVDGARVVFYVVD